jgi:hypothetical protein
MLGGRRGLQNRCASIVVHHRRDEGKVDCLAGSMVSLTISPDLCDPFVQCREPTDGPYSVPRGRELLSLYLATDERRSRRDGASLYRAIAAWSVVPDGRLGAAMTHYLREGVALVLDKYAEKTKGRKTKS